MVASIVNVASIWGLVGVGQIPEAGYAASKGGLVNLTRELAAQWARSGVRVNCLAPGWFRTEMTEGRMFGDERRGRWMRRNTPMGRGGEEHELDGALLFLASDASSFVTGRCSASTAAGPPPSTFVLFSAGAVTLPSPRGLMVQAQQPRDAPLPSVTPERGVVAPMRECPPSERGGIGRRAGFRSRCRKT